MTAPSAMSDAGSDEQVSAAPSSFQSLRFSEEYTCTAVPCARLPASPPTLCSPYHQ